MLDRMINNLNKDLSVNDINLCIARMNDVVAYGILKKKDVFFSITIKENLVKLSEEFYRHQADELAYKEVLSLTHQGQMEDVAKKIKTFFHEVAMKA
jgi:hypothetical protein